MRSKFLALFLCILATATLIGCLGGDSDDNYTPATGTVQGYVKNATTGALIIGATVTSASGATTTNGDGYFEIAAPVGRAAIVAKMATFITSTSFVDVSGTVAATVSMRPVTGVQSTQTLLGVDAAAKTATNDARGTHNASVDFPAGSIVNEDGTPAINAKVEIANSITADAGYADAFPGYFLGSTDGAAAAPIESFGYLDVNLFADDGVTKLKLGAGKTADIYIPADPNPVGNEIPLWRLNETTGVWENKGVATRVGATQVFKATVTSFSTYNLDKAFTGGIPLTVIVYDGAPVFNHGGVGEPYNTPANTTPPTPVAGANVTVSIDPVGDNPPMATVLSTNAAWQGRGITDANGKVTISGMPGGNLRITAAKGTKSGNAWSYTVNNGSASADVYFGAID